MPNNVHVMSQSPWLIVSYLADVPCCAVLQVMPNKIRVKVEGIFRDEQESNAAPAGENLRLRISGTGAIAKVLY
jgi:hypothetical protein